MKKTLARLCVLAITISPLIAWGLEVIPDAQWKTSPDVVSFQRFAKISGPLAVGSKGAQVRLTNLNSNVNSWYLLEVQVPGKAAQIFNLENPAPLIQTLALAADGKLLINSKSGAAACDLLGADGTGGAINAALGKDPYMALCDGHIYLRNKADGRKDAISWVTTGLRDVFGDLGDSAVNLVKEQYYDGKFFESGKETKATDAQVSDLAAPANALVSDQVVVTGSGIGIEINEKAGLKIGQWYKAKNFDGVFVSAMKAKYVPENILATYTDRVRPLNGGGDGETEAMIDSIAIDLSLYTFGWNNGTEHPGVGWSKRAQNNQTGAGPDGFGTLAPLTFPGVLNPMQASQTVAVLAGGFQRMHSAFKTGPMTTINRSHHYGFMEKGVVMSTLVPNLASVVISTDGTLDIKTWTLADNDRLEKIRDVRQNGVPLIETDPATGLGIPNALVKDWGPGNWSGSADIQLKTPRTSACIAERGGKRFLIFSYFSTHTPNAMARVLQAYQCKYAIHLDMNHPKFAYTAFFTASKSGDFKIEHLSNQMTDDVTVNGKVAPRSVLTPTYKDFFYVMKR